jgi:hypothetical protein
MEARRPSRLAWLIALANLAGASIALSAHDPCLVLSLASMSSNEFRFTLNAESGVNYTIQASTNFLDWVTVGTNAGPGITRSITITNSPEGQSFYRATRSPLPLFAFALAANESISLGSNSVVDSYNSCLGPYSTNSNGLGTNGSVATNFKASEAIKVRTAHVYGTVRTGPGGTVTYTFPGSVGDAAWNASSSGIQAGWYNDDMNICFPTNRLPTGPFLVPPVIVAGGSNITWLSSGNYQMASFTSSDSTKPMVVSGDATLYVVGNVTVFGSGYIHLLPGASLTLYVGGSGTISGGGVVNLTGAPFNFSYIGLPTNTQMIYSGSATFVGTICAPQAAVVLTGGGGLYGACIANSISITSSCSVHYDESLALDGTTR